MNITCDFPKEAIQSASVRVMAVAGVAIAMCAACRITWNSLPAKVQSYCKSITLYSSVIAVDGYLGFLCFKKIGPNLSEGALKSASISIASAAGLALSVIFAFYFTKESLPNDESDDDESEEKVPLRTCNYLQSTTLYAAKMAAVSAIGLYCYTIFKISQQSPVSQQLFKEAALNMKDVYVTTALKLSAFRPFTA